MIIIIHPYGQLGNRLLVFAHTLAHAMEHGLKVRYPGFAAYQHLFAATRDSAWSAWPEAVSSPRTLAWQRRLNRWRVLNRVCHTAASVAPRLPLVGRRARFLASHYALIDLSTAELRELPRRYPWFFLSGVKIRDWDNLLRHQEAIRHFFRPAEPYASRVQELLTRAKGDADVLVGLHIRHGDYKDFRGGEFFFPAEDYQRVALRLRELLPGKKVAFLLCSNARHQPEVWQGLPLTESTGQIVEDLYALAGCDYVVSTCSSYSWWAAFYGNRPLFMLRKGKTLQQLADFEHWKDLELDW